MQEKGKRRKTNLVVGRKLREQSRIGLNHLREFFICCDEDNQHINSLSAKQHQRNEGTEKNSQLIVGVGSGQVHPLPRQDSPFERC
jgi:hypothetical protein